MATKNSNLNRFLIWIGLATVLFLIDRITKVLIVAAFNYGEGHAITNFFNLVRVHNKGAAFSFLANHGGWQLWFLTIIAIGVSLGIVWLLYKHSRQTLFCLSLTGIVAGAMGNAADRMIYGYVVDFLDFYIKHWHYPAFNMADSFICLGVVGIIIDELRRVKRTR